MKISPVQGTPTIPNPSATGLSPEKLAAIKAMAAGQPKPEPEVIEEKEKIQLGQTPTSATQRIQMTTNRTVSRNGDPITDPNNTQENAVPLEDAKPVVAEATVAIPDPSVQAQSNLEAIKPISPELAQLAKEKRALQIEREQLAKEKEALSGQSAEALINKLKASPLSVLQEHGVTYDQLTNEILGQQGNNEVAKLQAQVDALTKGIDDKFAAKDTAQEEAVYSYMKQNVDKLSFSSEDYRLIRETKSQEKVMELIKKSWKEQGEILDEEEAMGLIEAELREDAKRYAKLLGYQEAQPQTATEEPQTPNAPQVQKSAVKTLTNKDSARPQLGRRQRAIAAMLGQK